jgi:GH25 family lysozyme M1 (1,4-beta-N-acetylmuramidase)
VRIDLAQDVELRVADGDVQVPVAEIERDDGAPWSTATARAALGGRMPQGGSLLPHASTPQTPWNWDLRRWYGPGSAARMLLRRALSTALSLSLVPLAALLAGCGASGAGGDAPLGEAQEASVCAAGATVKGVDVSVFQGTVDWADVKAAGNDFAIARISDGSYLDTDFDKNWSGIKGAGMVRGAYQFFEPGEDPVTQANIVITAVGKLGAGDLPVTADMEVTGGQSKATIAANLQTWVTHVQAGTGKAPMVYTAEGYWDADVGSTAFGDLDLWVANWGVSCPTLATGWSKWKFWQNAEVRGSSGQRIAV